MTIESIEKQTQQIAKIIEVSIGEGGDVMPELMVKKLSALVNISANSAEVVRQAKQLWRNAQHEKIKQLTEDQDADLLKALPASTLNELVRSSSGRYEALYDYCERLDKRVSYAIDALRTLISLHKSEIENNV